MDHQIECWTKPHVVTNSQIKTKMSNLILISILHSRSYERVLKSLNVVTKEILSLFSIGSSVHEIVASLVVCSFVRAPPPSFEDQIPALRLKSQPRGSNLSLKAQISASRLKSQPQGQIPATRLKSQPQGTNPSLTNSIWQKSPCVLQDIALFRAAALLTITYNHQHTKQGNGYRLPLKAPMTSTGCITFKL